MPLAPSHFTEPVGDLAPHLFPLTDAERGAGTTDTGKLATLLAAWITEGTTRAGTVPAGSRDAAVEAWVYYRAFRSVHKRLGSNPASAESADGTRTTYTQKQIDGFGHDAAGQLDAFKALLPVAAPAPRRRRLGTVVVSAAPDFSQIR